MPFFSYNVIPATPLPSFHGADESGSVNDTSSADAGNLTPGQKAETAIQDQLDWYETMTQWNEKNSADYADQKAKINSADTTAHYTQYAIYAAVIIGALVVFKRSRG